MNKETKIALRGFERQSQGNRSQQTDQSQQMYLLAKLLSRIRVRGCPVEELPSFYSCGGLRGDAWVVAWLEAMQQVRCAEMREALHGLKERNRSGARK